MDELSKAGTKTERIKIPGLDLLGDKCLFRVKYTNILVILKFTPYLYTEDKEIKGELFFSYL